MSFKPQKGENAAGLTVPIRYTKWLSVKLDGIRAITRAQTALTYSLKPVPNKYIREQLAPYQDLDGEIIVGAPNLESTFNTTTSAVRRHEGQPDFTFYVFDELSDFSLTLEQRYDKLSNRTLPPFIQVLQQFPVQSDEEVEANYAAQLELGYEGLILRNPQSLYKFGRSTLASQDLLKMKPEEDSEAVVLRVIQGTKNNNEAFTNEHGRTERSTAAAGLELSDMIGGFLCRDLKTGIEFACAPGKMTHDQRRLYWVLRDQLVGRIVKYRHMNKGVLVGGLPRFPRWIGWRESFDM